MLTGSQIIMNDIRTELGKAFFRPWLLPQIYIQRASSGVQQLGISSIYYQGALIVIDVQQADFEQDDQAQVSRFRQQAFTQSRKRLQQVARRWQAGARFYADAAQRQPLGEVVELYLISLQDIGLRDNGEAQPLPQSFGWSFYNEEQVLDESATPIQTFDGRWFLELCTRLDTFADWLNWLNFHRRCIHADPAWEFPDEAAVLTRWIEQARPFEDAWRNLAYLDEHGLHIGEEDVLAMARQEPVAAFAQLCQQSELWRSITAYYGSFVQSMAEGKAQTPQHARLFSVLSAESLMSSAQLSGIIRTMVAQQAARLAQPEDGNQDNKPVQLRSYHLPHRHYCLVLYAPAGPTSREQLAPRLGSLIEQVQKLPLAVPAREIVVIGLRFEGQNLLDADIAYRELTVKQPEDQQPAETDAIRPAAADPLAALRFDDDTPLELIEALMARAGTAGGDGDSTTAAQMPAVQPGAARVPGVPAAPGMPKRAPASTPAMARPRPAMVRRQMRVPAAVPSAATAVSSTVATSMPTVMPDERGRNVTDGSPKQP